MPGFDVVIIGNGILGLSSAYALLRQNPNLKIGIIGSHHNYNGGSTAAGAMLGCFGEVTTSTFRSKYGLSKLDIAIKAAKLWPMWLEEINNKLPHDTQVRINPGTFIISNTKSGRLEDNNYAAIIKSLRLHNEKYEEVEPHQIIGLNPIEDCRPLKALYLPNEGFIDPNSLMKAIISCITQFKSLTLIDAVANNISFKNDKKYFITTNQHELLEANHVLIAAGSYSQTLIDQLPQISNKIPKIIAGCGNALILNRPSMTKYKHAIRTPNRAGSCGIHLIPHKDHLYFGASNFLKISPQINPTMRYLQYLMQYAVEQINQDFHASEINLIKTGNRSVTIDTFPLIGQTSLPGLWILTGSYRDGVHSAPFLASYIADQILNKENVLFNNLFKPERFPIQTMTKEQCIDETVNHFISSAYEHSMVLPRIGFDSMFKDMLYDKLNRVYKKLDTNYVISTDLLIMLNRSSDEIISFFSEYYKNIEINSSVNEISQPIITDHILETS